MAKQKRKKQQQPRNRRKNQRESQPAGGQPPLFDDSRRRLDDPRAEAIIAALQHAAEASGDMSEADFLGEAFNLLFGDSPPHGITSGSDSDLQRANDLLYQLADEETLDGQVRLARQALEISPDCADAWSFLADVADSELEALSLYEEAIAAGRRAIGGSFDELRGEFWGFLETRPYMRALHSKAIFYESLREHDQAIDIYRTMLDLNPNDNQGVRWSLLGLLLLTQQHDDAKKLIDEYSEDAYALWSFGRLLLAFVDGCPDQELQLLLKAAHSGNEHVLAYLLADKLPPDELPDYFSYGDESEALSILPRLLPVWKTTPGATGWLRKAAYDLGLKSKTDDTIVSKQRSRRLQRAMEAPRDENAVWQVDYRKITVEDEHFWSMLAVDQQTGAVRYEETLENKPSPAAVFDFILAAILAAEHGQSESRPGEILFAKKTLAKSLQRRLSKLSVTVNVAELVELERFSEFIDQMTIGNLDEGDFEPADVAATPGMAWQVGAFQMPQAMEADGERFRPWAALVVEPESGLVLQVDAQTEMPTPDVFCALIRKAIFVSPLGQTAKPEVVYVRSHDDMLQMKEKLADWGIQCEVADKMTAIDQAGQDLQSHMGPAIPALIDVPNITPDDLDQFYTSAADFYRAAPWVQTRPDALVQIKSSTRKAPLFAVVMGQMGSVFGLAIYSDLEQIRQMYEAPGSATPQASPTGQSWSVMFGEQSEISAADSDAIEIHGWPVAAPEGFPFLAKIAGSALVPVSNRCEVQSMAECLSALSNADYPISNTQQLQLLREGRDLVELEIQPIEI